MKKFTKLTVSAALMLGLGVAVAQQWTDVYHNPLVDKIIQEGFVDSGSIKGEERVARLTQDDIQAACSNTKRSFSGKAGAAYYAELSKAQLASVVYPKDGQYLGNWKEGEKIAQNGRGLTWTDKVGATNGGGCYNCHQLSPKEISFGNLGPSLYQYGKNKGNSPEALKKTWAQIWNAKAFNACSWMPRFGHNQILTEAQLKDIMALLHDPESDVNK